MDWLDAFALGATQFTPYMSHTYLQTKTDGYTESGGSFPVTWDSSKDRTNISRLGLDAVHPVNAKIVLLGRIEGAHRYEEQGSRVKGEILGDGGYSFNLPGMKYRQDWLRMGTGAEASLGTGVASVMLNATTEGGNPDYWINAGYEIKF